ncbi:hypothetical protein GGS20DRAFT_554505 [Poronia punctata]|nr:hypothetical protein GGS20DRAFT_554505 [Poronia punctata]
MGKKKNKRGTAAGCRITAGAPPATTIEIKEESLDASQSYFSQVPGFEPDSNLDFDQEFGRFASSQNIQPGSQAWREERTNAISHEITFHYSQKVESDDEKELPSSISKRDCDLRTYRNMCREAGLEPLDTIEGCVRNLKSVLINIVDYINAPRLNMPIKVWPPETFESFKRYTLHRDRCIPKDSARGTVLEPLLQVLRRGDAITRYEKHRGIAEQARRDCEDNRRREGRQSLSVVKEESESESRSPSPAVETTSNRHGRHPDLKEDESSPLRAKSARAVAKEEPCSPISEANEESDYDVISISDEESGPLSPSPSPAMRHKTPSPTRPPISFAPLPGSVFDIPSSCQPATKRESSPNSPQRGERAIPSSQKRIKRELSESPRKEYSHRVASDAVEDVNADTVSHKRQRMWEGEKAPIISFRTQSPGFERTPVIWLSP